MTTTEPELSEDATAVLMLMGEKADGDGIGSLAAASVTIEEIAADLDIDPERVSRALEELKACGFVGAMKPWHYYCPACDRQLPLSEPCQHVEMSKAARARVRELIAAERHKRGGRKGESKW